MPSQGQGPSAEEQESAVHELQARLQDVQLPGRYPGEAADAVDFRRFLTARDFDVAKAESMARQHAAWRAETFPVSRDAVVDMLLESKRVGEILGWNAANEAVVLFDCVWGSLLSGGVTPGQFINAYLIFIDEVLMQMKARGSQRWCWLSIGGSPPFDVARQLAGIFEANYPELLRVAVIAPVAPRVKRVVDGMLWFLPERTRNKFAIASSSAEACELLDCQLELLPGPLRDLEEHERGRRADGVAMVTRTEDGHQQVVRFIELAAGNSSCHSLEVDAAVESVTFSLSVSPPMLLPRLLVGEQDVRLTVRHAPEPGASGGQEADTEGEEQFLVPPTMVGASSPLEQEWRREDIRGGSLRFEVDNSHSRFLGKSVQLVQVLRLRKDS